MNPVIDAIMSRRTRKMFDNNEAPTREQLELVIEAATWAPNHHMTEPWRFVVISGGARNKLGDVLATALSNESEVKPTPEKVSLERSKPLSAPVIVALISSPREGEKIVYQEELIAAGAALQNMLLAAHSLGLAGFVRTGSNAYSKEVKEFLKMQGREAMVGMVYIGYPAGPTPRGSRTPTREKVSWITD